MPTSRFAILCALLFAPAVAHTSSGATLPLSLDHGVVFLQASVNGQGPYAFILDPAAGDCITQDAARRLGLPSGADTVDVDLAIGSAHLGKLKLPVFPGDGSGLYPKHDPAGPPIAGALGPEVLKRFALRLDYGTATVTLTPLEDFEYRGRGMSLPIVFHDAIPLINASADGISGLFAYDVRAPGAMLLFHPFLERNGFLQRYATYPDASHPMLPVTLHALEIAGVTLKDQPARFGGFTEGKFAASDEAGILGYAVLSQFVTTIDYRHHVIYFEPTPPPR